MQKIITLTSSTISAYLQCPEKWNLAYNQHLMLAGEPRAALDRGQAFHKILELYYIERLTKEVYAAAQEATSKYKDSEEFKLVPDEQAFILKRFTDYIIRYQKDDFQPVKLANIPSTEIGFSHLFYEDEHKKCILEGKIDLISTQAQDLVFVDHKTQGRTAELYQFRPQFRTYSLISGIRKLVINYIGFQKEVKDNTFRRQLVTFPEHIIEQWKQKIMLIFDQIDYSLDNKERFTQNEESCGGPFSSWHCPFTALCEINPENKELINNLKQFKYTKNPYESWILPEEI